jgi:hypothetical protein
VRYERYAVKNVDKLREEAARSRRLAEDCTDQKISANLFAYAIELDERAERMESGPVAFFGARKPTNEN